MLNIKNVNIEIIRVNLRKNLKKNVGNFKEIKCINEDGYNKLCRKIYIYKDICIHSNFC